MASKKIDVNPLDKFLEEVRKNKESNYFREATKQLLVGSSQLVLTLTVNPCSKDVMITGESSIVNLIENAGLEDLSLAKIKDAMLSKNSQRSDKNKDTKLVFSELHRDIKKEYLEDQPVTLLPEMNHVKPDEWGVLEGRKVVGTYFTEIKKRNNNKYDKSLDKKPKWLPKEVNKIYTTDMTRDECTIVMKAILKEFPETNPRLKNQSLKKNALPIKNVIKRVRNMFSDNSDEEGNKSKVSGVGPSYIKVKQKAKTPEYKMDKDARDVRKEKKNRMATSLDDSPISHSTLQLDESVEYTSNTDLDDTDSSEITISSDSSELNKEVSQIRRSNRLHKNSVKNNQDIPIPSKKHLLSTDDSEEESIVKSFSKTLKKKRTQNVAKKRRNDIESSDDDIRSYSNQRVHQLEKDTNSKHKIHTAKLDRDRIKNGVEDTLELEERIVKADAKRNKLQKKSQQERPEEIQYSDLRQKLHSISKADHETVISKSEIVPKKHEKSHRIKENGMEHSDLRQKLFFGKAMQLQPRGGWDNWLEKKKGKNCSC